MKSSYSVPPHLLFLLTSCLLLAIDVTAIPLEGFYPFGFLNGDTPVERTLDGSSINITLPLPFAFFGEYYDIVYVSGPLYFYCNGLHTIMGILIT